MNPKVEKLKKYFWKALPHIEPVVLTVYVPYAFCFVAIGLMYFTGFEDEAYSMADLLPLSIFLFFLSFIPYSIIRFLFTKNTDKIHKILFYWFSFPLSILILIYLVVSTDIYRILIGKNDYSSYIYDVILFMLLIQPILTVYLFLMNEKIQKDVVFLYILPIGVPFISIMWFVLRLSVIFYDNNNV